MSRRVCLTNSVLFAVVDDKDYERVSEHRWNLLRTETGRIQTVRTNDASHVTLQNFILGHPIKNWEWDHRDRNPLNCRRRNLRLASRSQNSQNRNRRSDNGSGFIGVHWHSAKRKWEASLGIERVRLFLGNFKSPEEAARARDAAAFRHFGKFASLNFRIERYPRLS